MIGKRSQIDIAAAPDDVLAGRSPAAATRGGNFATSSSSREKRSLPSNPSGTLGSNQLVMRSPDCIELLDTQRHRHAPHRAKEIDRDGIRRRASVVAAARARTSRACPPPGIFITRSAISHSSRSTETGCEIRFNSPLRSNSAKNCPTVSTVMPRLQSRDAPPRGWPRSQSSNASRSRSRSPHASSCARAPLRSESCPRKPGDTGTRCGCRLTSRPMSGKHVVEVEAIERAHDRHTGHRELQDHERRTVAEDAKRLAQCRHRGRRGCGCRTRRSPRRPSRSRSGGRRRRRRLARRGAMRPSAAPARSIGSAKSVPSTIPRKRGLRANSSATSIVPAHRST